METTPTGKMEKLSDFGDVLEFLGSTGKYQKILLYAVVTPIAIIVPILHMTPIFLLYVPNHWCHVPETANLTKGELILWMNKTLPLEQGLDGTQMYSQCQIYNSNGETINCPNGWDYDRTDFSETLASDFDWVCSREHYPTTLFTVIQAGTAVGTIIGGLMADRIGRRPVFFVSLCFYIIFRLVSFFIPQHFPQMVIVTFISSMGYPMVNMIPTMILAELCDDEFRSWSYSLSWLVYVAGMASVPYISYFSRHWFFIGLATTLPSFAIFMTWFFFPESPRWLTSVGRTKKAAAILRQVAKFNGTFDKMTNDELEKVLANISKAQRGENETKPNIGTLFTRWTLAKHMILLTVSWSFSNLIYDCITLNTPNMSGDQFLNFFLLAIVEAPSSFVGGYMLVKLGRRWTGVIFFLLCSISCFTAAVFLTIADMPILVIVATFIAKFAINITNLVVYLQTTELLPTPLRATGNAFGTTISSVVGIVVPSLVFTSYFFEAAPYLVMGCVAAFAMLASSFLPETMNQNLPETIDAASEFGKGHSFWKFRAAPRTQREKSENPHDLSWQNNFRQAQNQC